MKHFLITFCLLFNFIFVLSSSAQDLAPANQSTKQASLEKLKTKFLESYQPFLEADKPLDEQLEDPLFWRDSACKIWVQKKYKLANQVYLDSKEVMQLSGKDETIYFTTKNEKNNKWKTLQIDTIKQLRKEGLTDRQITEKLGQGSDPYISYLNHVITPKDTKFQTVIILLTAISFLVAVIVFRKCMPGKT